MDQRWRVVATRGGTVENTPKYVQKSVKHDGSYCNKVSVVKEFIKVRLVRTRVSEKEIHQRPTDKKKADTKKKTEEDDFLKDRWQQ